MRLETISFDGTKWSAGFPDLDSEQTLVLVFGASEFIDAQAPLGELRAAYPRSKLTGCSSAGEIHGTRVLDGTLSVAVAKFDHTPLALTFTTVKGSEHSFGAGEILARELAKPDLRSILILSEGLNVNGSELVRGVNSVVPSTVIVTGGLAGDGSRFKRTWVLRGGEASSNLVAAIGFYGDRVVIGHGSKGGWDKFGPERKVTKSKANVLYELDGSPALALYKKYLGDRASELPASGLLFPLSLRANADEDKSLVRTILAIDEENQSMTFAGDIPEGHLVQLMRANMDRLIGAATTAAEMTRAANDGGGDTLAVAISCVGRRLVLGERIEEETESALEVLPKGTKQVGFYSYGEISPYTIGSCDLHNQTMTLTTVTER
ncbi:MAG: FIST C-terminal domain-containing protein [Deltaproteobacteria bacterium]|nr:FIST C-terminal domain-containing protein [Deltaproteobacteria bacterium]